MDNFSINMWSEMVKSHEYDFDLLQDFFSDKNKLFTVVLDDKDCNSTYDMQAYMTSIIGRFSSHISYGRYSDNMNDFNQSSCVIMIDNCMIYENSNKHVSLGYVTMETGCRIIVGGYTRPLYTDCKLCNQIRYSYGYRREENVSIIFFYINEQLSIINYYELYNLSKDLIEQFDCPVVILLSKSFYKLLSAHI